MANVKCQMANLTEAEVKHVAKLARLSLIPEEIKKFQEQLSEILDYVNQLKEVNTENVEPTSQVTGLENVFRNDEVMPSLRVEEALSSAPAKMNNFFKTKLVLEK